MGNKSSTYGNATGVEVAHDIPSATFTNLDGAGEIRLSSLLDRYYGINSDYLVVLGTHSKWIAKWCKFSYNPQTTTWTYLSTSIIGIFDSYTERQLAVNAALGRPYTIYNDYFYKDTDLVYGAAYSYVNVWKITSETTGHNLSATKPTYMDLINGYALDTRSFPKVGKITPTKNQTLKLAYYRENTTETYPDLRSIDFYHYDLELTKGQSIYLPIERPVMGTLWVDDANIEAQLRAQSNAATEYPVSSYFPDNVPTLFSGWNALYTAKESQQLPSGGGSLISTSTTTQTSAIVKILGANNNVWNNGTAVNDVGFDLTHPMFKVDETLAYQRYFKPQTDGSYGNLIMNSPKLDDLWTHFCSQTPAANELDSTRPRMNTHGHLIQETANRIGYKPDADGTIDVAVQKTELQTQCANIHKPLDTTQYSPYGFGKTAMAIANLPHGYSNGNPTNGGGSLVTNLPNLMLELHAQLDKSFGIQDASNIVFSVGDKKVHYPNQVAMLIDLSRTVAMMSQLVNTIYTNSLQTESEVREIIGAIGLGTTDDSVGLNINNQSVNIPYKGVDRKESIVNELADIKLTLAVIMGKLA